MNVGRRYLLAWLTVQWLVTGPVAAMLTLFMFFTDGHGLPTMFWPVSLAIFCISTLGYVFAIRAVRAKPEGS